VQKKLESEDIEKRDFLSVQCKGKKMKSHFVTQVGSASTTYYEIKYLKKMMKSTFFCSRYSVYVTSSGSLGKSKRKLNQLRSQVKFCSCNTGCHTKNQIVLHKTLHVSEN
jgi:hypothetical protein